jgi:hypothetical protein
MRRALPGIGMTVKNLHLNISGPETTEACVMQAPQIPGLPSPVCMDMAGHLGAVWVFAGEGVAQRIAVCVNACNDLESEQLVTNEVRVVLAEVMRQNALLLQLLAPLAKNAFRIQHGSYSLEGNEDFDVGAIVEQAKEVVAAAEATNAAVAAVQA